MFIQLKNLLLLLLFYSCSFEAKENSVDIKYLKILDTSLGEYKINLKGRDESKNLPKIK